MTSNPDNLLILGAGFSANAGLPVASDFTHRLLATARLHMDGPSTAQVRFLRKFVSAVFNEGGESEPEDWPELEDVFTIVDLSANTGHNLGPDWSASELRVVRRAIIVRMIRMLAQRYAAARKKADAKWQRLEQFFRLFDHSSSAILSMNWDTVVEQGIARTQGLRRVDYGCDALAYRFSGSKLIRQVTRTKAPLRILKPHGSVNWLYCDTCRETFWVPADQTEKVARTLFRERDWDVIREKTGSAATASVYDAMCPRCRGASLGTRFATFSYRKALDFPMHAASWRTAERYLKNATEWIFIGYSMPAADFEFKHLLKRVQLSQKFRPNITLITGGEGGPIAVERFTRFFGDVPTDRTFFTNGLNNEALAHLKSLGVLRSQ